MRSRYKIFDEKGVYFITSTIVDWRRIFISKDYNNIIIENLSFYRRRYGLKIYSYVILEDHFHAICSCNNLSDVIKAFKSYTAKQIIKQIMKEGNQHLLQQFQINTNNSINPKYQIWQKGFHPQLIKDESMLVQKMEYIHNNPIRKGLVNEDVKWKYSSASNYKNGTGIIEIDRLDVF